MCPMPAKRPISWSIDISSFAGKFALVFCDPGSSVWHRRLVCERQSKDLDLRYIELSHWESVWKDHATDPIPPHFTKANESIERPARLSGTL